MSGRAGRRGKDERGICIIMIDERVIYCQSYINILWFMFPNFCYVNFSSFLQSFSLTCRMSVLQEVLLALTNVASSLTLF